MQPRGHDFESNQEHVSTPWFCSNKDEITEDTLSGAKVYVLAGCKEKFTAAEASITHMCTHQ